MLRLRYLIVLEEVKIENKWSKVFVSFFFYQNPPGPVCCVNCSISQSHYTLQISFEVTYLYIDIKGAKADYWLEFEFERGREGKIGLLWFYFELELLT